MAREQQPIQPGMIAASQNAQMQTRAKDKPKTLQGWIEAYQSEIKKALPSVMTPERFTRIALSAASANPALSACDYKTFLGAMMQAAQLGLEPNTPLGQAYLIPYKGKVTFQLGYKGMLDLVYRTGSVAAVDAQTVYEHDTFDCEFGLEPKLRLIPADGDRGRPVKYYAMFKTKDGVCNFAVATREEMEVFARKYSQSFGSKSSPWHTAFDEMAKKTLLKRLLKYAPLSTEFKTAYASDGGVRQFEPGITKDMFDVPPEEVIETGWAEVQGDTETAPGDVSYIVDENGEAKLT